jgi:uncharacterized protein (DUF2147 family)
MQVQRANQTFTTRHEARGRYAKEAAFATLPHSADPSQKFILAPPAASLPAALELDYSYVRVRHLPPAAGGFRREDSMIRTISLVLGASMMLASGAAIAAEPIEGTWKRPNGTLITYAPSGGQFCGTVMTGEYKGKSIGCMAGTGANYTGSVNKLDEGKTYKGKATISGNTLGLAGCVMGGMICKTENLVRQ